MHTKLSGFSAFLILLALTAAYQFLYCHVTPSRDLASLFSRYDGQIYRTVAHDPLSRKGSWEHLDHPRYRARRILIPGLAALLSKVSGGGSTTAVDFWYVAVTDVLMALGGLCFVRLAQGICSPLAAVIVYSFIPAIVASTDRMVLDGPMVAGFLAAWLFYRDRRTTSLLAVLVLLPLIRETAIAVTVGAGIVFFRSRDYRKLTAVALTTLPFLAWSAYVAAHTPASRALADLSFPLVPQVLRLFTPVSRPVSPPENLLLQSLDFLGMVCLLITFALVCHAVAVELRRGRIEDDTLIVLPAAILAAFSSGPYILVEPYAFLRVNSVPIAWAALRVLAIRQVFGWAYVAAGAVPLLIFRVSPILRFAGLR